MLEEKVPRLTGTPRDAELREEIFRYAIEQAAPAMRRHLKYLCFRWEHYTAEFFGGALAKSMLAFEEPGPSQCYGEFSTVSCFGGSGQIMIRPALLKGTLQGFDNGNKNEEGLRRFTEEVLLHEMIHQWQYEASGIPWEVLHRESENYKGHGATFSAKANEIGAKLGIPPVRKRNKASHSGKTGHLPTPSQWPHCVYPPEHYLGAYVPPNRDKSKTVKVALELDAFAATAVEHFDREELCKAIMRAPA